MKQKLNKDLAVDVVSRKQSLCHADVVHDTLEDDEASEEEVGTAGEVVAGGVDEDILVE